MTFRRSHSREIYHQELEKVIEVNLTVEGSILRVRFPRVRLTSKANKVDCKREVKVAGDLRPDKRAATKAAGVAP